MSDDNTVASPADGQAATSEQVIENKPADIGAEEAVVASDADEVTEASDESEQSEEEQGSTPQPRKRSSTERYRRKISYLAGEAERKQARIAELEQQLASKSEEAEPDPAKYEGGEYDPKFIRDLAKHIAKSEVKKSAGPAAQPQVSPELIAFQEKAKRSFPDLEKRAAEFYEEGGRLSEHVAGAIFSSENGPAVLNHLIENPELADEISGMTPMQAAVKIGRLDAAFGNKPTRTVTKAPPPLKPPSGGASPPQTPIDLAKSDDVSAYVALRRQQRNARA